MVVVFSVVTFVVGLVRVVGFCVVTCVVGFVLVVGLLVVFVTFVVAVVCSVVLDVRVGRVRVDLVGRVLLVSSVGFVVCCVVDFVVDCVVCPVVGGGIPDVVMMNSFAVVSTHLLL